MSRGRAAASCEAHLRRPPVARALGLAYVDTGAMYRAVTWLVQQSGVNPEDSDAVEPLLIGLELTLDTRPGSGQTVLINGKDVSHAIRSPEVTAAVSAVAAHRCVRQALTAQQKAMQPSQGRVSMPRGVVEFKSVASEARALRT